MNAQLINKRIQELKEENFKTKPQNMVRFKNPYLLKSETEILNDILNRKSDHIDTAQNPPMGDLIHFDYSDNLTPSPLQDTTSDILTGLNPDSENKPTELNPADPQTTPTIGDDTDAQADNNANHPLSRPNADKTENLPPPPPHDLEEDLDEGIERDSEGYEIFKPEDNKTWMRRADGTREKLMMGGSSVREGRIKSAFNDLNTGDSFTMDGVTYSRQEGADVIQGENGVLDQYGRIPPLLGLNAEQRGEDLYTNRGKPLTKIIKIGSNVYYYYGNEEMWGNLLWDRNAPENQGKSTKQILDEIGRKGEDILTNMFGGGHGTSFTDHQGGYTGFGFVPPKTGSVFQP